MLLIALIFIAIFFFNSYPNMEIYDFKDHDTCS